MPPIVEVHNLHKSYQGNIVVKDVTFTVEKGTCFGLLGPNGAGKTTIMEMVEDIISPSHGEILYKGTPRTQSFREEIGIQFQHTSLLSFLTVHETLTVFHKLFQKPADIQDIVKRCDLHQILKKYNNKLSGGQLQRLMIGLALINQPKLVFLDEPSTGLDPQARRNLWSIVKGIKEEGKTIILTTHSMEEAEFLCDEIAILDQGIIIAKGSPHELISTYCNEDIIRLPKALLQHLPENAQFTVRSDTEMVEINSNNIDRDLKTLMENGVDLSHLSIRSGNLEEVFLRLTGKQLRE